MEGGGDNKCATFSKYAFFKKKITTFSAKRIKITIRDLVSMNDHFRLQDYHTIKVL